jgi:hypothetical protein
MAKGRRTDNTMAKGRRTDNTMAKGRRTDVLVKLSLIYSPSFNHLLENKLTNP